MGFSIRARASVSPWRKLIVSGTLAELAARDLGAPLHSLVLCGNMHPEEVKVCRKETRILRAH